MLSRVDELNQQEDEQYGKTNELEGQGSTLTGDQIAQRPSRSMRSLESPARRNQKKRPSGSAPIAAAASKMRHYERQEQVLDNRNSYSKTDQDAIFMRMKDGQFLPAIMLYKELKINSLSITQSLNPPGSPIY